MFKYLASLIKNDTGNSSKSFTLVLSAIISFIAGLTICGILIYDAYCNGYIKTDLEKAGIFMLTGQPCTHLGFLQFKQREASNFACSSSLINWELIML